MAIAHAVIAAIVAVYGERPGHPARFGTHKSAGNGAVFMGECRVTSGTDR